VPGGKAAHTRLGSSAGAEIRVGRGRAALGEEGENPAGRRRCHTLGSHVDSVHSVADYVVLGNCATNRRGGDSDLRGITANNFGADGRRAETTGDVPVMKER
jgi:hypothetical protein